MNLTCVILVFLLFSGCGGGQAVKKEGTQETYKISPEVFVAIENFQNKDHAIKIFFERAYGFAVFPTVGKAAFGVGVAYAKGEVFENRKLIGFSSLSQLTIGYQLGGQTYSEIIFFKTKDALKAFLEGNFEFGARTSAVLLTVGASADMDYSNGVAIFTIVKGGLMYEASVGGQKFSFKPVSNGEKLVQTPHSQQRGDEVIVHAGTGFILNSNGYLLTNYHVVKGAKNIKVKTTNGEEINAVLIMKDASNDIAVLKIKGKLLNPISNMIFGDSSKMKEGDKVFTIGYPLSNILGQQPRYTEGVINSLYGIQDDPRLFQISVPIQPGNSGGPLFNEQGEIIGIAVASLDAKNVLEITGALPQNINFAIKSAYIKNLLSMMPDLGSALVMPTDLSLVKGESKSFIEKTKNNIVLIEAR